MVTGDQLLIGKETARQLGMGTNMYTAEELLHVSVPDTHWHALMQEHHFCFNLCTLQPNTASPYENLHFFAG